MVTSWNIEPFATTEVEGGLGVIARIHGGGITGRAGALRLGVARCLSFIEEQVNRPGLKKAGQQTWPTVIWARTSV